VSVTRKVGYEKASDFLLPIKEDANIPAINYHLGMIFLRLSEKARAKQYLQVAIGKQPAFPGREEAVLELKKLSQQKGFFINHHGSRPLVI